MPRLGKAIPDPSAGILWRIPLFILRGARRFENISVKISAAKKKLGMTFHDGVAGR